MLVKQNVNNKGTCSKDSHISIYDTLLTKVLYSPVVLSRFYAGFTVIGVHSLR